jgi:hypothetical protein
MYYMGIFHIELHTCSILKTHSSHFLLKHINILCLINEVIYGKGNKKISDQLENIYKN